MYEKFAMEFLTKYLLMQNTKIGKIKKLKKCEKLNSGVLRVMYSRANAVLCYAKLSDNVNVENGIYFD